MVRHKIQAYRWTLGTRPDRRHPAELELIDLYGGLALYTYPYEYVYKL